MMSLSTIKTLIIFSVLFVLNLTIGEKETYLPIPQLINKYGYPSEVHHVTTPDGYILALHRIPHGRNKQISKQPVLVQHGIYCSSAEFLLFGNNKSLGYILADAGFDVWLGNSRGNYYSRNHTTLDPNTDSKFWNFSWHEMGTIDLPTVIDYILKVTNKSKINYVGNSQGDTDFYVMTSTLLDYNSKIKAHYSLAPVVYLGNTQDTLLKLWADWLGPLELLLNFFNINEILSRNGTLARSFEKFCKKNPKSCAGIFNICNSEIDISLLPTIFGYFPAGCSTKQLMHYGQEIASGYFRQFDYGQNNVIIYGDTSPPSYNLSLVTVKNYLFYSKNDGLVAVEDVDRLCTELGDACTRKFLIEEENFKHRDFLIGRKAPDLVYSKIVRLMKEEDDDD